MRRKIILGILFLSLSFCLLSCAHDAKSFAYAKMVNWNGIIYVASDQETEKVERKLGSIKYYSTDEKGSQKDCFSNFYQVGTDFYSISGIDVSKSIAIESSKNKYTVLVNKKLLQSSMVSASSVTRR